MSPYRKNLLTFGLGWAVLLWWLGLVWFGLSGNYGWGRLDTLHFWAGARTLLDGGDPYIHINTEYENLGPLGGKQFHPLPWVAVAFIPLATLPFKLAVPIWIGINLLASLIVLGLIIKVGQNILQMWQIFLLGWIGLMWGGRCLQVGQISILETCFFLTSIVAWQRRRDRMAGVLMGLTLFKPWIVAGGVLSFSIVAWKNGQRAILKAMGGTMVTIVTVTSLIWPHWLTNYHRVNFSEALGRYTAKGYEYWPVATFTDFIRWALKIPITPLQESLLWGGVWLAAVLLGGTVWKLWSNRVVDDGFMIAVSLLLTFFVLPYVRYYDYIVLVVYLILFFRTVIRNRWYTPWLGGCMMMALFMMIGTHPESWVYQIVLFFYLMTWIAIAPALKQYISFSQSVVQ